MKKQISIIIIIMTICTALIGCTQKSNVSAEQEKTVTVAEEKTASSDEENTPVFGTELVDGTYPIEVKSSSSMFRIVDAKLTVKESSMSVLLTLSGKGYSRLYMGKGEQAEKASEEEYIDYVEDKEGNDTYEVPIEALDKETDCAAWSIKKERWYNRVLVFQSDSLPSEAFKNPKSITAFEDGSYEIAAVLVGGTGKANIKSPVTLKVNSKKINAEIEWDSPYYDYMIVDEIKYTPIHTEGNAVFQIPVENIEKELFVTANTTAMSQPHEIEYTIRFDSNSIKFME